MYCSHPQLKLSLVTVLTVFFAVSSGFHFVDCGPCHHKNGGPHAQRYIINERQQGLFRITVITTYLLLTATQHTNDAETD